MNAQGPSFIMQMAPFLLIIPIFYFLLIRPQQKQEKNRKLMISNLNKGDKIITTSGIVATVDRVMDNYIDVKISDNVKIKILRTAVMTLYQETPQIPQHQK